MENLGDRKRYWCVSNPFVSQSTLPAVPKTNGERQEEQVVTRVRLSERLWYRVNYYTGVRDKSRTCSCKVPLLCARASSCTATEALLWWGHVYRKEAISRARLKPAFNTDKFFCVCRGLCFAWLNLTLNLPDCRCGMGRAQSCPTKGSGKHSAEPWERKRITSVARLLRELYQLY